METYISLLRGINVTGSKLIKMIDLKKVYESLKLKKVTTYIQSGNAIFQSEQKDKRKIAESIESGIKKKYNFDVPVLVIEKNDLETIEKNLPFKNVDETRVYISYLFGKTTKAGLEAVEKYKEKDDKIIISKNGTEIYLYIPNGYGKSKLSNSMIENKLKLISTTRNLNTTRKLIELAKSI